MMVEKVNHNKNKGFDKAVLKDAHQQINGRQCARLENIKAQMKSSLVESKTLNARLQ